MVKKLIFFIDKAFFPKKPNKMKSDRKKLLQMIFIKKKARFNFSEVNSSFKTKLAILMASNTQTILL